MKKLLNPKEAEVIFLQCIAQTFKYCSVYDNVSRGSRGLVMVFFNYQWCFSNTLQLFRIYDGYFLKII